MKTIFFLLSFIPFISIELNAQQDTVVLKDSVPSITVTMPDSFLLNPSLYIRAMGPWSYDPHKIQINLSKIFISPSIYESPYTPKGARKDVRNGKPVILFWGGMTGVPDFSSEEDKIFQQKYGVEFFSQGCLRMPDDDQEGYNKVIFDYLDKKYGKEWRYELRDGAVAFAKPFEQLIYLPKSISELNSPLALQLTNPNETDSHAFNPETETSVWWYVLPTSGFALLLSLYFIIKRKRKD